MYLLDADFSFERQPVRSRPKNLHPMEIIEAFRRTLKPVMEVRFTRFEYKDTNSCRSTFANSLSRMHLPHIQVVSRGGRVYLINDAIRHPARYGLPDKSPTKPAASSTSSSPNAPQSTSHAATASAGESCPAEEEDLP